MASKTPNLETSMQQLEELVEKMESGELSLEDSLKSFEQGIKLSKQCQKALQAAEQKVRVLMDDSDDAPLEDFNEKSTPDNDNQQTDGFDDELPF